MLLFFSRPSGSMITFPLCHGSHMQATTKTVLDSIWFNLNLHAATKIVFDKTVHIRVPRETRLIWQNRRAVSSHVCWRCLRVWNGIGLKLLGHLSPGSWSAANPGQLFEATMPATNGSWVLKNKSDQTRTGNETKAVLIWSFLFAWYLSSRNCVQPPNQQQHEASDAAPHGLLEFATRPKAVNSNQIRQLEIKASNN